MGDFGPRLLVGWSLANVCYFIGAVFVIGLGMRVLSISLAAWEAWLKGPPTDSLGCRLWRRFKGVSNRFPEGPPDYWFATILGWLELTAVPILISSGAWAAIGGWITLKTVAQWDAWKTDRNVFNRYLITQAAMLIAAYVLARWLIVPSLHLENCFIR